MYTFPFSLLTANPAHGPASYHFSLDWLTDLRTTGIAWLTTCSPWGSIPVLWLLTCIPGSRAFPVASCISHGSIAVLWLFMWPHSPMHISRLHACLGAPYLSHGLMNIPGLYTCPTLLPFLSGFLLCGVSCPRQACGFMILAGFYLFS